MGFRKPEQQIGLYPGLQLTSRNRWQVAVGLSLLYASAYYLPLAGSYYVPDSGPQILYPTVLAVLVATPLGFWIQSLSSSGTRTQLVRAIGIALLCSIAISSAFSALGYSALSIALIISDSHTTLETTRWIRVALVITGVTSLIVAVRSWQRYWPKTLRVLSYLGFVYALLAVIRVNHFPNSVFPCHGLPSPDRSAESIDTRCVNKNATQSSFPPVLHSRRVVWIIMDELDYNETLAHTPRNDAVPMPNLSYLANIGVSATDAYSPAKDTVASIPSLLTGYPLTGLEFRNGVMMLKTREAGIRAFQQSDSIFSRLPAGPSSAAILGFYHPYCSLFPSITTCISAPYENVGRWFDALTFFGQQAIATARYLPNSYAYLPRSLFHAFEPMYRITEDTLQEYQRFLSLQDKSLTFIHVNLPHPPGDYAQRALGLKTVGDDRESYRRNLQVVDRLIGEALSTVKVQSPRQDILFILSSDHWHRTQSPLTPQRIPWIAWHVGESVGTLLSTQISTVHTADLILSFLKGDVDNQKEIATWWQNRSYYPTLMPHGYEY